MRPLNFVARAAFTLLILTACSSAEDASGNDIRAEDDATSKKRRTATNDEASPEGSEASMEGTPATPSAPAAPADGGVAPADPDSGTSSTAPPIVCAPITQCKASRDLGSVTGDGTGSTVQATGIGSQWLTIKVSENSLATDPVSALLRLTSAPGSDYDLHVYQGCSTPLGSSDLQDGVDEVETPLWEDRSYIDDSKVLLVEIRHADGPCDSAHTWKLDVLGAK